MDLEEKIKRWEKRIAERPDPALDPAFDLPKVEPKEQHVHKPAKAMSPMGVVTVCVDCGQILGNG